MKVVFRPINDRVLLQRLPDEQGLIRLTDAERSGKGVVLSTGPGKWMENENGDWWRRPLAVRPGDIVRFTARWNDLEGTALSEMIDVPDAVLIQEADIWWVEHHNQVCN
jgi:co-chaperonin GroES (HSP10)